MSSAQLDIELPVSPYDDASLAQNLAASPVSSLDLKQQVAERLAAHRARRRPTAPGPATPIAIAPPAKARAARIAATVAERYAHSPSYRAVLAAEAENAIRQAEAAVDVAILTAQAVADAQYNLLAELDNLPSTEPTTERDDTPRHTRHQAAPRPTTAPAQQSTLHQATLPLPSVLAPSTPATPIPLTIRPFEPIEPLQAAAPPTPQARTSAYPHSTLDPFDDEGLALDQEIAFRQSPVFDAPATPPVDIPANLIEFPRQLVAARRARPRLAEGPLRDDDAPEVSAQLRIFEVEPTQVSISPTTEAATPVWSSIVLDAQPHPQQADAYSTLNQHFPENQLVAQLDLPADLHLYPPPQTAPLDLRLMSAAVDTCLILTAFIAFTATFALTARTLTLGAITLPTLALASSATLVLLAFLYLLLFFTFSDATPGMRFARIGLCTLSDENPSRAALRRRVVATLLSLCPLGLGFLWAWIDGEGLGWHDRISRMYQRSY